jgi:L-rhamnose mutarotase
MRTLGARPFWLVLAAGFLFVVSGCEPAGPPQDRWPKPPTPPSDRPKETAGGERVCEMVFLSPDKVEEYRKLHKDVPGAVQESLRSHHFHDFSVHFRAAEDQNYVVRYYQYTGTDHALDKRELEADPAYKAWREACETCEMPVSVRAAKQWWLPMEEIFHNE